jgi:purine-binding chemotaxis protein CheW
MNTLTAVDTPPAAAGVVPVPELHAGAGHVCDGLAVREILEYAGVTPVPQMPPSICGVINLRGTAVPVLDLARRLERAPSAISKRTCIIVVEVAARKGRS